MARIRGGRLFQELAVKRLTEVLVKHGKAQVGFRYVTQGFPHFSVDIDFQGKVHNIAVFENDLAMYENDSLFECYMPEEFKSELTLIEGFASRLDRYLSGGPWEGPDEKGLPDLIKEKVMALFRWLQ